MHHNIQYLHYALPCFVLLSLIQTIDEYFLRSISWSDWLSPYIFFITTIHHFVLHFLLPTLKHAFYSRVFHLIHWPTLRRSSSTVFLPSWKSTHTFLSFLCKSCVTFLTLLRGGSPLAFWRITTDTSAWSLRIASMAVQTEGLLCPTSLLNPKFQLSQKLFVLGLLLTVGSNMFHSGGGNIGWMWRIRMSGISSGLAAGICILR